MINQDITVTHDDQEITITMTPIPPAYDGIDGPVFTNRITKLEHALRNCIDQLVELGYPRHNYAQWMALMKDALDIQDDDATEVTRWDKRHSLNRAHYNKEKTPC